MATYTIRLIITEILLFEVCINHISKKFKHCHKIEYGTLLIKYESIFIT